jgi:hypothetical protein
MTPCSRCNGLGFVTLFTDDEHGRVEVCPACRGAKYQEDLEKAQVFLGVCKFCSREIHFPASDIPCTLGRKAHVIAPRFNASIEGAGVKNG